MPLSTLKKYLSRISHLRSAAAVLEWDQETYMPEGAVEARATQVATLRELAHTYFTAQEMKMLLENARQHATSELDVRFIQVIQTDYEKALKIPSELVARKAHVVGIAKEAWKKARQSNDFALFAPHLEKIVALNIEWAEALGYAENPYDALIDQFEPNMTTQVLDTLFANLRTQLVPLIRIISENATHNDEILHQHFDIQKQWNFGMNVLKDVGYDFQCGRQDISAHPFSTTFDRTDVRITTRIMEDFLPSALFGTLHEAGHALYEQGIDAHWAETLLSEGTSLGMHESQSRLWENQVGRSQAFWKHYYPALQSTFPKQLANTSLESFYRAINHVQPSLIRVEADEVTYPLHIMLRFELEKALVNGEIEVADLPTIWNEKMHNYLGVMPQTVSEGVLQDIHWSLGELGYFPTYALGTLMSAQIFAQAEKEIPHLHQQFANGEFMPLREWLRQHIHQFGRAYTADEILRNCCGESLSATAWLNYIREKYV